MSNYLITWFDIQKKLTKKVSLISPQILYKELISWCKDLKMSKDTNIKRLYDLYLKNYEFIDICNYYTNHMGAAFNKFLEYDYIKQQPKNIERAIILTRDILWNIVAFKSQKECPNCNRDKLRVLTDANKIKIYLSCDDCSYIENLEGQKINIDFRLQPADKEQIDLYQKYVYKKNG